MTIDGFVAVALAAMLVGLLGLLARDLIVAHRALFPPPADHVRPGPAHRRLLRPGHARPGHDGDIAPWRDFSQP